MRKIVLFITILSILLLTACTTGKIQASQMPEKTPPDFNFIFNYGVNAKNQLDTQKGTFTKDMVTAPSVITELNLTNEEMNEIYAWMNDINILGYPDNFKPESNSYVTPFYTYSIKIDINGKVKSIYWEDEKQSGSKEAVKLRELFKRIEEIIIVKKEYKKLPEAKGGYD